VAVHELPLGQRYLHGHFSKDLKPVVEAEPGDSVRFFTPNHAWDIARDEHFAPANPELDEAGHALAGPVFVRGAKAGQTLVVRIDEVEPSSWGVSHGGRDHALHWELADGVGRTEGFELDLAPFLGVMGMPPAKPGVYETGPPRWCGGNVDCKELVVGTTFFLPIPVDGARFSAGDGHGRQGDGEVSGTAIECPIERAELTLRVRRDFELRRPLARTDEGWITFGVDVDLDDAAAQALDGMLELMHREHGLDRQDALALASVAVDVRVTQLVNGVLGVHAVLPHGAIRIPS
jgi:acetamidase/formamidase